MILTRRFKPRRDDGFMSGLEASLAAELKAKGVAYRYEPFAIPYEVPTSKHRYNFDFVLKDAIVIEGKGEFTSKDRRKHKLVRQQHPEIDIRFVFSNPQARIGKKSSTTYAKWCERLGIKYAHQSIPDAWLKEPRNKASEAALRDIEKGPTDDL